MNFLTTLIGGFSSKIILFIFIGLLAAGGTWIGVKMYQINRLEAKVEKLNKKNGELTTDNTILTANNAVLKDNQIKLAAANKTNLETTRKLLDERRDSVDAIAALAQSRVRDQAALTKLNGKIAEMLKDPKNDGEVSPVLREIIRDIQKQRGAK